VAVTVGAACREARFPYRWVEGVVRLVAAMTVGQIEAFIRNGQVIPQPRLPGLDGSEMARIGTDATPVERAALERIALDPALRKVRSKMAELSAPPARRPGPGRTRGLVLGAAGSR
jgi:hypothetical protein